MARKLEIDTGLRDGVTREERDHIKALEREVKELRQANEILKLASAFLPTRISTADSNLEGLCGALNGQLWRQLWPIGYIPLAEAEANDCGQLAEKTETPGDSQRSLGQMRHRPVGVHS